MRRGKYWKPNAWRESRAEVKREHRRQRNMRQAVRQGTHYRVVSSGTSTHPGIVRIFPVESRLSDAK